MNKILVLAAALMMSFSLAGCAEKISKNSDSSGSSSASKADKSSSKAKNNSEDDILPHTNDGKLESNVFDCSLYTFSVDTEKWLMTSDESLDCYLMYIKDDSQGSFNIISTTDAEIKADDLADYAQIMKDTNESAGNITFTSDEETTLGGIPAYKLCFTQKQDTGDLSTEQMIAIKDNNLFIITYSAASDYFEQLKADVDTMLGSFKIK